MAHALQEQKHLQLREVADCRQRSGSVAIIECVKLRSLNHQQNTEHYAAQFQKLTINKFHQKKLQASCSHYKSSSTHKQTKT